MIGRQIQTSGNKGNRTFGILDSEQKIMDPFKYNSIIVDDFRFDPSEEKFIYALDGQIWKKMGFAGDIISENCNECDFIKKLAPFEINHYGFEYIGSLMISGDDINRI